MVRPQASSSEVPSRLGEVGKGKEGMGRKGMSLVGIGGLVRGSETENGGMAGGGSGRGAEGKGGGQPQAQRERLPAAALAWCVLLRVLGWLQR